jgi:hypothetical protein
MPVQVTFCCQLSYTKLSMLWTLHLGLRKNMSSTYRIKSQLYGLVEEELSSIPLQSAFPRLFFKLMGRIVSIFLVGKCSLQTAPCPLMNWQGSVPDKDEMKREDSNCWGVMWPQEGQVSQACELHLHICVTVQKTLRLFHRQTGLSETWTTLPYIGPEN